MNYIFFDLDGTLHQQDMLEAYLKFMIRIRPVWTVLSFPILLGCFLFYLLFSKKTWGLNPLFFIIHFGLFRKKQAHLVQAFKTEFLDEVQPVNSMLKQLKQHIQAGDYVVIISGSLQSLIETVYPQLTKHKKIKVIGSQTQHFLGSTILTSRCSGRNKLKLLDEQFAPQKIKFEVGYTDSLADLPVLKRCKWAYLVNENGKITLVN